MTDHLPDRPIANVPAAVPPFDPAAYRTHIASFDLTAEQERELLETLASVLSGFVEMGFRYDVCAAVFGDAEKFAGAESGAVDSLQSTFAETTHGTEGGPS